MKSKVFILTAVSVVSATAFIACTTKSAKNTDGDGTDSTEIAKEVVITRLPDTTYTSVELIKYTVERADTLDATVEQLTDLYANAPGAFTFRKGMHRLADFGGTVKGRPTKITKVWEYETKMKGTWGGGSGWTGQPLYVEWPDSIYKRMKSEGTLNTNASPNEILVGSLCGEICCIDFKTGKESRPGIDVNNPIKGTISLDPTLNGNLYVGQGIPDHQPFGALVVNLFKNKVTHTYGRDPKAGRGWGAYDSSPLRLGEYLFRPGENGTFYKFRIDGDQLQFVAALRFTVRGMSPGMEASMGIYHNYGYVGDNSGMIVCVNLDTMNPVWCYDIGDDVDSSIIVMEDEDGTPYIYTGCEIDKKGVGNATYVKLNALTGEEKWKLEVPGRQRNEGSKHFDGGFYGSGLPGLGNCSNLIFLNCVLNTAGANGELIAVRRDTGEIAYTTPTDYYAWSSPVGFVNENNEMYIVTGDCRGHIYLIDGATGKIIFNEAMGNNFESSPVVVGNELVMGSRGNKIIKMRVE